MFKVNGEISKTSALDYIVLTLKPYQGVLPELLQH